MSDAFCLPLAVNLAPARRLGVAIAGLHCLPLPLLWPVATAAGGAAWLPWFICLLCVLVGLSLTRELRNQRLAAGARRLEVTAAGSWLLHDDAGRRLSIRYIDRIEFGGCMVLLVAADGRRFRLMATAALQSREQWHRLRVLLRQPAAIKMQSRG